MINIYKPKIEELKDEKTFWNNYRELRRTRGINIDQDFAEWASEEQQSLTSPGAREDFAELCEHGCTPQVLALIVWLMRKSPQLETFWKMIIGPPAKRQKATRTLERAASTLEEIFAGFIALGEKDTAIFTKIGRTPPAGVVSELRWYVRLINLSESLRKETGSHSLGEVSKYLLSSCVRRMTGSFHDRNVSGLVGEVAGVDDYSEVAQRMWRKRNYGRLDKHLSWMTNILVAASVVIAHPA
ncbi:MAG TPA: hypothetical protein VGF37_06880 [Chthoniobacterales bacterium]|jgi:hypothetical protein